MNRMFNLEQFANGGPGLLVIGLIGLLAYAILRKPKPHKWHVIVFCVAILAILFVYIEVTTALSNDKNINDHKQQIQDSVMDNTADSLIEHDDYESAFENK